MFLHWNGSPADEACREVLLDSLFAGYIEVAPVKRAVRLLLHRLSFPAVSATASQSLLLVLSGIVSRLQEAHKVVEAADIVSFCFDSEIMRTLSARSLQSEIREGGVSTHLCIRREIECVL